MYMEQTSLLMSVKDSILPGVEAFFPRTELNVV